jgi:hypothetical protein
MSLPNTSELKQFRRIFFIFLAVLAITGGIELWMGRSLFGPDGKPGLWESSIWSSENSQRFADPYSFSHIVHGILFYGALWLVARRLPAPYRFLVALVLEAGWEISKILRSSSIGIARRPFRSATSATASSIH